MEELTLGDTLRKLADLSETFPEVIYVVPLYLHPRSAEDFVGVVKALGGGVYDGNNPSNHPLVRCKYGRTDVTVFVPGAALREPPRPAQLIDPDVLVAITPAEVES